MQRGAGMWRNHEVCGVVAWLLHSGCVCIIPELFSESLVCAGSWGEMATRRVGAGAGGLTLRRGCCYLMAPAGGSREEPAF